MVAYISFGKWNKNCKYIFIAILINILYDIIYGVNYEGIFEEFRLFGKSNITFNQHIYIHEIFNCRMIRCHKFCSGSSKNQFFKLKLF